MKLKSDREIIFDCHVLFSAASHPILLGTNNGTLEGSERPRGYGHIGILVPSFLSTYLKTVGKKWLKPGAYPAIGGKTYIDSKKHSFNTDNCHVIMPSLLITSHMLPNFNTLFTGYQTYTFV